MNSKTFIPLLLALCLSCTPAIAKSPIVKKITPTEQVHTAKIVSGNGTENAMVILPAEWERHDVVVADSTEFKALKSQNAVLEKQVEDEKVQEKRYQDETDKVVQEKAAALTKLEAEKEKSSFFSKILSWIGWIGGGSLFIGIAAIIAICVFFPPALPFIEEWLVAVVKAVIKVLKDFAVLIESTISSLMTKKPTATPVTPTK